MAFFPTRVELCGVKICDDSGLVRAILDTLCKRDSRGRFVALSGEELANVIRSDGGPTAIAGAVRNFRNRVKRTMLVEANLEINPGTDLIVNDRQHGYRFSEKIEIVESPGLLVMDQQEASNEDVPKQWEDPPSSGGTLPSKTNEDTRARWILAELKKAGRVRKQQIIQRTGCGDSTARRTLAKLRDEGKIVFVGSARNGYWRLA